MAVSEIAGEDFSDYIYYILIAFNILIYLFSGILLDWMMGYKKTDDPELNRLVQEVAKEMGLNPKRIKVRYGKYPILNAMAYGCYGLDMHMAIIAPDLKFGRGSIDKDEIRGVIAHEFAHLKGKHTLILTLLGSLQLIVYKLLGWPATFFDYSFRDDLPFDLWIFLLINFAISMVLYVFVRNLEARSDRAARKAGYKLDLAKGLYNLESYYATSHEIGLDATLLSDEKLTKNNRKLNYLTTASYLNQNMINPGKGTLLSNLINAHPPSYHRILAILHPKEIKPMREALLPFSLLSKKRAREFFNETHEAQKEYAIIATEKIKHEFEITDIRKEYKKINKRDQYAHKFGKTYAFLSRISQKRFVAQIIDIKYINDAANPIVYVCRSVPENKEGKEEFEINPMIYEEKPIDIGKHFYFKKHGVLRLESIDLEELYLKEKYKQKQPKKVSKEAYKYYHTGILNYKNIHTNERVIKPIFKTRIPQPLENLEILAEKYVFLKEKGTYLPLKKESMTIVDDFKKIQFKFKYISENNADPQSKQELTGTLEDYVIKFRPFYAQIHGDQNLLKKEIALFTYFMNEGEQILTILKKAVNSEIPGKIVEINVIKNEKNEISDETILKIDSIFSESHEIPINKIDSIFLQKPSMILEKKSSNSSLSKIFNKIQAKRHPERILYDIQPSNDKKTE
jgi:Zn-dependent protease with chaperone function